MEERERKPVPEREELEAGRCILVEMIEENPRYADLPGVTKAYISLMLLHPVLKMYLVGHEEEKVDFMTYSYMNRRRLCKKLNNIISDLCKYATPSESVERRGKWTDLSPVRRAALTHFFWWRKFISDKEYYLNWQEGKKDNILLFPEIYYDIYVSNHLEKLAKMRKDELLKMLSRQEKRKHKKRKKEYKHGEEHRRQAPLFPTCKNTDKAPTTDDGGAE